MKTYLISIGNAKKLLVGVCLLAFLLFMINPYTMLFVKAFGGIWGRTWLPESWGFDAFIIGSRIANIPRIVANSLVIAGIAVLISILVALPVGWALGRRNVPNKNLLLTIFLLPRMIPPIAFAVGIAKVFYTLDLVDTHLGVGLAHVAVCAPYGIMLLTTTFESLDDRILEAARVCGASPIKNFFFIILPLILPGLITAIIFTFTASYNEFTLTIMTYGPHTQTLPVKAYLVIGDGFLDVASAISVILLIPSLFILLILQRGIRPEKLFGGFKGV